MYKKGKGASAFGRTNWSKRWFELDGTHLSYWEGFSPAADRPLGEPKGRVAVIGPTYSEHAHCWRIAGHEVIDAPVNGPLPENTDTVVIVNPNNPDGARRDPAAGSVNPVRIRHG